MPPAGPALHSAPSLSGPLLDPQQAACPCPRALHMPLLLLPLVSEATPSQGSLPAAWPGRPPCSVLTAHTQCVVLRARLSGCRGHGQTRTEALTVTAPLFSPLNLQHLAQGLVNIVCKGPDCKYFRLCRPSGLCCSCSPLPFSSEVARDYTDTNECGCVPVKSIYGH